MRTLTLRQRRWGLALAFAALLLRALIPTGFMPGSGGLVLCPGTTHMLGMDISGMAMPGMDMGGDAQQVPDDGRAPASAGHYDTCVFAASVAGIAPPGVHAPLLVASALPVRFPPAAALIHATPSILRAQSARAPPRYS